MKSCQGEKGARTLRVFVAMSGGVDSSVGAALLKRQGFDVTGVFIKTWSPEWLPCEWRAERRDAMRVAAKLKIPLITLDLTKEYKEQVVDYMIAEYKAGRVPNPDVMCNKVIKFGGFFNFAMRRGADFVATGHYARISSNLEKGAGGARPELSGQVSRHRRDERGEDKRGFTLGIGSGVPEARFFSLLTGSDKEKDQTYFLWTLGQKELSRTLFPIGHLQKPEVRKLARKFGLPNAEKKDSQGLCFMGKIDVKKFLKHYIKEKPGAVLNERGEKIGLHGGVNFFTIGERHGFTINKKGANDLPYYVVDKDLKKNILVVSNKKNGEEILKREVNVEDLNWNQGVPPVLGSLAPKLMARVRYRQELQKCRVELIRRGLCKIIFDKGQIAAPGQSVVFYSNSASLTTSGNICLGGGVIV